MSTIFLNVGTGSGGVGTATVTLQAFFDFLQGQTGEAVNFSLFNPESPCTVQAINLVSGANTISASNCPQIATAAGLFIMPPPGNGTTLTLKGVTGDTGIPIAFTGAPSFISFANPPPTSFVITANTTLTGLMLAWV
jgi:hypothetical protein